MKTVEIVPSVCKGEDAKWSGSVTMRLPSFDEKFALIEAVGSEVNEAGEMASSSTASKLKQVREMVKASQKHYVAVNLCKVDGSEKVTSFEEMQYCDDLHTCMIEIAGQLLNGFKLGNG